MAMEGNTAFEYAIKSIPGQGRGVSLDYFLMLADSETRVKEDRWVIRFLEKALRRTPRQGEAQALLTEASYLLTPAYPHLTPRQLDTHIWATERVCKDNQ